MHHAFLIIGTFPTALAVLPDGLRESGIDVTHATYERFGIDDVRKLTLESTSRPVKDSHRTFVLALYSATHEAQNALLKTLEEPAATALFYIIVPREDVLIATVRSRLMVIDAPLVVPLSENLSFRSFLQNTYSERLETIALRTKAKDDAWIEEVVMGIEGWAAAHHNADVLKDVVMVREYMGSSGASKKMLLEHIALTLPALPSGLSVAS